MAVYLHLLAATATAGDNAGAALIQQCYLKMLSETDVGDVAALL